MARQLGEVISALRGEFEALSGFGDDEHRNGPRVQVEGKHNKVAGRDLFVIHGSPAQVPPESHPHQRICPQCDEHTWLGTQHCVHCHYDLFAHDAQVRKRAMQRRKYMWSAPARRSASAARLGPLLPVSIRPRAEGIGGLALLAAFGLSR